MSRGIDPIDPDLKGIEQALGALVPIRMGIDRDRLMYLAGRASTRPAIFDGRAWAAVAASLAAVSLGEAALLARRSPPVVVERVVVVHEPEIAPASPLVSALPRAPSPRSSPPPIASGFADRVRLVEQVLSQGLDGLPSSPRFGRLDARTGPSSSARMLQDELRRLQHLGDPS